MTRDQSFAELQRDTDFALAVGDVAEARAAIRAMEDFVDRAKADLDMLIQWKAGAQAAIHLRGGEGETP